MAVYLVRRCHYDGPSEKYIKTYDDETVFDWIKHYWSELFENESWDSLERVIGRPYYGFLLPSSEEQIKKPKTFKQLKTIDKYLDGEALCKDHCIQIITDDDELQMAYYLFDHHYLEKHSHRAAYLLHHGWQLDGSTKNQSQDLVINVEAKAIGPVEKNTSRVWINFLAYYDSGNLYDLEGPCVIQGVNLREFPIWLANNGPTNDYEYPFELRLLRCLMFLPPDDAPLNEKKLLTEIFLNPSNREPWKVYQDLMEEKYAVPAHQIVLERALARCCQYPFKNICGRVAWKNRLIGDLKTAYEDAVRLAKGIENPPVEFIKRSQIAIHDHMCQMVVNTACWDEHVLYHQWIIFDDIWASSHQDMANGVLLFAKRWDVLT